MFYLDPTKGELGSEGQNYIYDLAEAKRLVTAAGYPDGFDIDYIGLLGSRIDLQRIMIDEFKKSGFVRPHEVWWDTETYFDNITYAAKHKGLAITSAPGNTEPDYALFQNYHSSGGRRHPMPLAKWMTLSKGSARSMTP